MTTTKKFKKSERYRTQLSEKKYDRSKSKKFVDVIMEEILESEWSMYSLPNVDFIYGFEESITNAWLRGSFENDEFQYINHSYVVDYPKNKYEEIIEGFRYKK